MRQLLTQGPPQYPGFHGLGGSHGTKLHTPVVNTLGLGYDAIWIVQSG